MKLQRTKEKRDGKAVYLMNGYEISFKEMSPRDYSNWNIERRWYEDNEVKPNVWGFKTLQQLKRVLENQIRDKRLKIYEGGEG